MKDYLMHNGKKYEISTETATELARIFGNKDTPRLSDFAVGDIVNIEDMEFLVLEQLDGKTAVIFKGLLYEREQFGNNNNNYDGSNVDNLCNEVATKIAKIVGEENIYEHEVDLTANNGMKCYGTIMRKASLLTVERVRKYADVLSEHSTNKWEWLSTPCGTQKWGTKDWILCVAPSGYFDNYGYGNYFGVRPFCILNSNIFVSK